MPRYALRPDGTGAGPITVSTTVTTTATGAPVDAGSLKLTVRKPDGTSLPDYTSPAHDGTGLYHQDIPKTDLLLAGHYSYVWTVDGAGAGVSPGAANFDLFDPFEASVLPLSDAKAMLNIVATDTTDDAEIMRKIATLEANIERYTGGPILNRPITERVDASDSPWELRFLKRPLVSVTSVTDLSTGLAVDLTDTELDTNSGFARRKSGMPYVSNGGVFTAVYVAGWGTAVPPGIEEAAAVILQHLWMTQRGAALVVTTGGAETVTLPGFGYPVPVRAAGALAPYARVGAVA